jgi:thiamine biosynthesis lipoprotein
MTSPTAVPAAAFTDVGVTIDGLWHSSFRSMASPVRVQLGPDTDAPKRLHERIRALFGEVERECTRFDPDSDLMRANVAADGWWPVGKRCYDALRAAAEAHVLTGGGFDPRVLRTLVDLGYAKSLTFASGPVDVGDCEDTARAARRPWTPDFDEVGQRVRIGADPVDLGGIGKGLALRWTADLLRDAGCTSYLVDAGGDCVFAGAGPDGGGWRIGVEDPAGGDTPVAVLSADEGACATSSIRLRTWRAGGRTVHHLIDPRTGHPGGVGLRSVTVLGSDPAIAEVWSKVLFLHGRHVEAAADERELAALWVHEAGVGGHSAAMAPAVIWRRS